MEECNPKFWNVFDQFGITIPCSCTYFLKVAARVSLKIATKGSIGSKKNSENLYFWVVFLKEKNGGVRTKSWKFSDQFGINIPCLAACFLEVCARVSLKVASKGLLEIKRLWKIGFLGCFSKVKTEECDLKFWIIFNQFGITIPCSDTYFLEVGARISLKVATKVSIRRKKCLKV